MTIVPTTQSPIADTARHPLSDGRKAAGRAIAEGAPRHAPSAPLATAIRTARAALELVELVAVVSFVLAFSIWASVLT